jgi:mycothiol synthase
VTGEAAQVSQLTPAQIAGVLDLLAAAADSDGVAPLSEHGMLHVRHSEPGQGHDVIVTGDDGTIAGYAYRDPPPPDTQAPDTHAPDTHAPDTHAPDGHEDDGEGAGELVVHPAYRHRGLGTALIAALDGAAAQHPLRLWAHGDLPAAAALARATGFERFRALWQMRRSLSDPLPDVEFPQNVQLRTFRVGQDEDQWLRLNGRAFAKHPEQGAWTSHDLELRETEPWFDPDGFFIAAREPDGAMAGFHWTKIHPNSLGEVYVVGIDPDAQGGGLGRALTLAGLDYLRKQGLNDVMLYVDEENTAAIKMYSKLGFTRWHTDAMYRRPGAGSGRS